MIVRALVSYVSYTMLLQKAAVRVPGIIGDLMLLMLIVVVVVIVDNVVVVLAVYCF